MRLPKLTPEDMTPRQKELSERISGKRGGTRGPFLCWLHSPELCDKVEALGAYARFESSLDLSLRELILLIAARNFDAQYSWNAHIDRTVEAGVSRDALEQLARRERPDFGDQRDQELIYRFCTELLTEHFVSDKTFSEAHELFGSTAAGGRRWHAWQLLDAGVLPERLPGRSSVGPRAALPGHPRIRADRTGQRLSAASA